MLQRQPHFYLIILLLLTILGSTSCKKDPCDGNVELESDVISEEARSFNPYTENTQLAIFKDNTETEYSFRLEENLLKTSRNFTNGTCPDDADVFTGFEYEGTYYRFYLRGVDINLDFHLFIGDVIKPNENNISGENLWISYNKKDDPSDGELCLNYNINQVDEAGNSTSQIYAKEIGTKIILGKSFNNVITGMVEEFDPQYEVYFNIEFGIVGFLDNDTGTEYVFDRFEN